jgi:hypothetical protein
MHARTQRAIKRASDRTPRHNTPGGPITGNRGGPMPLAENASGGPMLVAGDTYKTKLAAPKSPSQHRTSQCYARLIHCCG